MVLGILPFFHSFGFTVTLWTVLCLGKRVVYHFNPLDAKIIGTLCEKHGVTLLDGHADFMRTYLQRCEPKQFATLVHLILGAEKLKPELAREIQEKLGIEPMEGYGCTELSPVVAVNTPHEMTLPDGRTVHGNRPGTVGLPLPGTAVKTVDPETGPTSRAGREGMILVKGPQVMVGYLNRPEATAKVLKDGWYTTGDLGYVDADGFLKITDRLSRFSKIGGEMVPHMAVESAIMEATGARRAERGRHRRARPEARRAALRAPHRPGHAGRRGHAAGSWPERCPGSGFPRPRTSSRSRRSRSSAPARSTSARLRTLATERLAVEGLPYTRTEPGRRVEARRRSLTGQERSPVGGPHGPTSEFVAGQVSLALVVTAYPRIGESFGGGPRVVV